MDNSTPFNPDEIMLSEVRELYDNAFDTDKFGDRWYSDIEVGRMLRHYKAELTRLEAEIERNVQINLDNCKTIIAQSKEWERLDAALSTLREERGHCAEVLALSADCLDAINAFTISIPHNATTRAIHSLLSSLEEKLNALPPTNEEQSWQRTDSNMQ